MLAAPVVSFAVAHKAAAIMSISWSLGKDQVRHPVYLPDVVTQKCEDCFALFYIFMAFILQQKVEQVSQTICEEGPVPPTSLPLAPSITD